VHDGVANIRTEKSGFKTVVTLLILPVLDQTLRNLPTSDLAFICGSDGQPLAKETFGNYFRAACNEAGVYKLAHCVRKISATRAANEGATVVELKALFGWTDDVMLSVYTRCRDRIRFLKEAITKLQK